MATKSNSFLSQLLRAVLMAVLLLPCGQALGNPTSTLTLEDVLKSVDNHYPEIISAEAMNEAARGRIRSAAGSFDPRLYGRYEKKPDATYENEAMRVGIETQLPSTPVKLGVEWERAVGPYADYDGDKLTGTDGRLRSFIEVPLLRDFVIDPVRARLGIASFFYAETIEESRLVRLNTYRQAAIRYWMWVSTVEKKRIAEDLLEIAMVRDKALNARVRTGDAPRIDQIDNQRQILQRRANVLNATLAAKNAALMLSLYTRSSKGEPDVKDEKLAPRWLLPLQEHLDFPIERSESLLNNHPVVQTLVQDLKQKEVTQSLTRHQLLPRVDFRLSYGEEMGELPTTKKQANEWTAGLNASFPLLNREASGNRRAINAEIIAIEQKLAFAKQKLKVDFHKAHQEAFTAENVFKLNFEEIDLTDKVEKAEKIRFKQGESNLFTVNLREVDTALAKGRAVDSLVDFRIKELELKLTTNTWTKKY